MSNKALSQTLDKITRSAFAKRGFAEVKILSEWDKIVGETLSKYSAPRKLHFSMEASSNGTLHIEVYDSGMAMEMSFLEPIIIEKIATYFGYKAVSKIKIIQNIKEFPEDQESNLEPVLTSENQTRLSDAIRDIDDDALRNILESLGTSILSKTQD